MLLGDSSNNVFDIDIIMHTNTVLAILTQLGVGPRDGFYITGDSEKWTDFISEEGSDAQKNMRHVRTYVYMKVRLIFDPPTTAALITAYEQTIAELEWRILNAAEENKHRRN